MTIQERIDVNRIQKLQDKFCMVAKVSAFCIGGDGSQVTTYSGDPADVKKLIEYLSAEQLSMLISRVGENSLEDLAVEDTKYPYLKIAATYIRNGRNIPLIWVVCGILQDAEGVEDPDALFKEWNQVTCESDFYKVLDLLHDTAQDLINNQTSIESMTEEKLRNDASKLEMQRLLHRAEMMTNVVQLLDNQSQIEVIMNQLITYVGEYLDISSAQIFRLCEDPTQMDVIAQWCNKGEVSFFDRTQAQPVFHFLEPEKPIVISYDSDVSVPVRQELELLGATALICFPVLIDDSADMFICFVDKKPKKRWEFDEVKVVSDSLKVYQSILTKRIQENSLASSFHALTDVLDNVGSAVFVKDEERGEILFANRQLQSTFASELEENRLEEFLHKERTELFYEQTGHWYEILHHKMRWLDGSDVYLYSLYDITERKAYQRQIEKQAYTDFLTGMFNRMCCERDLGRYIDDAKMDQKTGALLYLDLDDFKHINDGLGHQYGDVLLRSISDRMRSIKGIEDTCYRMGGDEFVVIIPAKLQSQIEVIISQLRDVFAKPWYLKGKDYYCTMSMGVVRFPDFGDEVQEIIKKADITMYAAKRAGKNQLAYYSDSIDSTSTKRLDMEKSMRDAVREGCKQFEVYFQPIMNVQLDGSPCVGAEALLRWNSKELGCVTPADFIPLAEYLGLIMPIGDYVLHEACRACNYWNNHGHPNYKVNVNLSVVQLLQSDIVDSIERAIEDTGIDPHHLTLEVTESLAINDMIRMQRILSQIKALGVRLALDDFGTGYSSLNHIREIPFDVIKVDQGFVKELAEDAYSQAFVKMVGELADTLGKSICVEGIETNGQLRVLGDMHIQMVQGFHFDKPLPRDVFEEKYVRVVR